MKIKKLLAVGLLSTMILTGCGASFTITPETLETYAEDSDYAYADISDEYTDYSYIDGVYVMASTDAHVELWDLSSADYAAGWFQSNVEDLENKASSNIGSSTSSGGDYAFTIDGEYYRVFFSGDTGIYAYGEKDSVINILTDLEIMK